LTDTTAFKEFKLPTLFRNYPTNRSNVHKSYRSTLVTLKDRYDKGIYHILLQSSILGIYNRATCITTFVLSLIIIYPKE